MEMSQLTVVEAPVGNLYTELKEAVRNNENDIRATSGEHVGASGERPAVPEDRWRWTQEQHRRHSSNNSEGCLKTKAEQWSENQKCESEKKIQKQNTMV